MNITPINITEVRLAQLWDITQKRKEIQEEERLIKDEIIRLAQHKTLMAGSYVFLRELRKGSVQYKDITILKEIDLDVYRKEEIETWKIIKAGN